MWRDIPAEREELTLTASALPMELICGLVWLTQKTPASPVGTKAISSISSSLLEACGSPHLLASSLW